MNVLVEAKKEYTKQLISTDSIAEYTHFDVRKFTAMQIAHRLFVSNILIPETTICLYYVLVPFVLTWLPQHMSCLYLQLG